MVYACDVGVALVFYELLVRIRHYHILRSGFLQRGHGGSDCKFVRRDEGCCAVESGYR